MWLTEANQRHGETRAELLADWRGEASPVIAYRGDVILYLSGERGETAKAFNALAQGVAALACHQGGVKVFGLLWCAEHHPGGKVTDEYVCARCVDQYPDAPKGCTCCTVVAPVPPEPVAYVGPRADRRRAAVQQGPAI